MFLTVIRNLNKNSYYGCIPTIYVYETDWSMFEEYREDKYCDSDKLYFNDRVYSFRDGYRYRLGPNLV